MAEQGGEAVKALGSFERPAGTESDQAPGRAKDGVYFLKRSKAPYPLLRCL